MIQSLLYVHGNHRVNVYAVQPHGNINREIVHVFGVDPCRPVASMILALDTVAVGSMRHLLLEGTNYPNAVV